MAGHGILRVLLRKCNLRARVGFGSLATLKLVHEMLVGDLLPRHVLLACLIDWLLSRITAPYRSKLA